MGNSFILKSELARELGLSREALRLKMREKGIEINRKKLLSPREVESIKKALLF
jgi:hypothetical protein